MEHEEEDEKVIEINVSPSDAEDIRENVNDAISQTIANMGNVKKCKNYIEKSHALFLVFFFEEKHQKTHQVNLNKNLKLLILDFENEINFLNKSDMEVEGRESTNEISETQVTNDKIEAEQTQRETEERIETANTTSNRSQNENRQNTKNNIRKN